MTDINLFVEYQKNSTELLKVLGEMSQRAEDNSSNRPIITQAKDYREQVATIELFWDMTEKIFLKYEERLQVLRLTAATEHAKAIILRNELRQTYNEMYKVRDKIPETILKLMKSTALPSKEDFNQDVTLKTKPNGEKN